MKLVKSKTETKKNVATAILGSTRVYISITAAELDFEHLENVFELKTDYVFSYKKGDVWKEAKRDRKVSHWASCSIVTKSADLDTILIEFLQPFKNKRKQLDEIRCKYDATLWLEVIPSIEVEGERQIMPQSLKLMEMLVELQLEMDLDYYI